MWKNAKFLNETADDTYGLPRVKKLKEKQRSDREYEACSQ